MTLGKRPYKLIRTRAEGYWPSLVRRTLGTYGSLEAAIRAAQQAETQVPDGTTEIMLHGTSVRSVAVHGQPSSWTTGVDRRME